MTSIQDTIMIAAHPRIPKASNLDLPTGYLVAYVRTRSSAEFKIACDIKSTIYDIYY
jgi:hypothetical protein